MLSLFHYYPHLGSSSSRRCSASGSTLHLTGRNAAGRRRDKSAFFDRFLGVVDENWNSMVIFG
jgi:hypothetical protein